MRQSRIIISYFTLVELLVVTAIIGVLSSLLLPTMLQSIEEGQNVACINNLRQIGVAEQFYIQDYGYFIPCWSNQFSMTAAGKTWIGMRSSSSNRPIDMTDGFLSKYLQNNYQAMTCPLWRWDNDFHNLIGGAGYGYNVYGVGSLAYYGKLKNDKLDPYSENAGAGIKADYAKRPDKLVAFTDVCTGNSSKTAIEGYSFLYPRYNINGSLVSSGDQVHFRHLGRANVLWADSHVEAQIITRFKDGEMHSLAVQELIGGFGPDDSSLYDPR